MTQMAPIGSEEQKNKGAWFTVSLFPETICLEPSPLRFGCGQKPAS
jgi:hypothetical protein